MKKSRVFNDDEVAFLLKNHKILSYEEMAKTTGKRYVQVKGFFNSRGMRVAEYNSFTKEESALVKKLYNQIPTIEIGKRINKTTKQVSDHAYGLGLKRDIKKISKDDSYFKNIDSEEKAYWLGFIYADGSISEIKNKNTGNIKSLNFEITLASEDKNHLEKLSKAIAYDGEIKDKKVSLNEKTYTAARLSVSGKEFCENLIDKGCVPRKSLILKFPSKEVVPDYLIRHFIRGYFDGDGCVHFNHGEELSGNGSYIINFVGTKDVLEKIKSILIYELNLGDVKLHSKGRAFTLSYGGFFNFSKILDYLYTDSTVYLDRKYEKYQEAIATKTYLKKSNASRYRNVMKKIEGNRWKSHEDNTERDMINVPCRA